MLKSHFIKSVYAAMVAVAFSSLPASASATDTRGDSAAVLPSLMGTSNWEVRRLLDAAPIRGTTMTARFSETSMAGSAGCNRYSTSVMFAGGMIRISPDIATTRMACAQEVMRQEATYLDALRRAYTYSQRLNELTLYDLSGRALVTFVRR